MHGPQIAWLIMAGLDLGLALALHGRPRRDKYSFWTTAITIALNAWILKLGGFFG
jgi:hypothetical protein